MTQRSRSVYWRGAWPTDIKLFGFANLPLKQIYSLCARRPSRTSAGRSTLDPTRSPATGACASSPSSTASPSFASGSWRPLGLRPGRRSSWTSWARPRRLPRPSSATTAPSSPARRCVAGERPGAALNFIQPGKPTQDAFVESFNGKFPDSFLKALTQTSPTAQCVDGD